MKIEMTLTLRQRNILYYTARGTGRTPKEQCEWLLAHALEQAWDGAFDKYEHIEKRLERLEHYVGVNLHSKKATT